MPRFLVRIVAGRVVAADQRPARVRRWCSGAEQCSRLQWKKIAEPGSSSQCTSSSRSRAACDALQVGPGLVADLAVIDPAQVVRALEHLQAAVLLGGPVHGDQAAGQVREQAAVVVPVAVILVPFPGAADRAAP